MKYLLSITALIAVIGTTPSYAQDLLKERIWKISSRKRSIFLDKGVFHSDRNGSKQKLVSIRNSFTKDRGYERIVLDFSSSIPPQVYGKISSSEKRLYLDLFKTGMGSDLNEFKNEKYLKSINFFNIDEGNISIEMNFAKKVSFDIFYLKNPGRIVIDVKK